MKATKKILFGIGLATVVGLVIYVVRRQKTNRIDDQAADQIADEGYETAHDILFPKKNKGGRKTMYGPVLPS